jgi:branched-chain amino acid transport system substrate-binding protein
MGITRRDLLKASAAGAVLGGIGLPAASFGADSGSNHKTVKIGMLAPFTGSVAGWGLPGLYGLELHAKQINAAGGVKIGGEHYNIEILSYDSEYKPNKALEGYKKMTGEGAKLIMMLGGDPWPAVERFANHYKMLSTTLLPSDLSPNTPYLLATSEVHPIYNVTGVEWMHKNYPDIENVTMGGQNDSLGLPSLATYEAAFKVAGIDLTKENVFSADATDFAPIVSSLISHKPDCVSLDTAYPDFVNLMCQQLKFQSYKGQKISCTCDNYEKIIDKTSLDFMKGLIFQFPDFDDPKMEESFINFKHPHEFAKEYDKQHPGTWTAVSWEYASNLDLWKFGSEKAGSMEPMDVLKSLKSTKHPPHIWGKAEWFGKELWGIDNALVGQWPVVQINDKGKARIQEFGSVIDWWHKHKDVLIDRMKARHLLYSQRS